MDFHGLIWLIVFALAFRYGLPWFLAHHRKKRLATAGIADIDTMDGLAFEQYLEVLFGKLGYKVQRTRYVGDYGADLIIHKDGTKTVVQAKRYTKAVGIKAVQEAVAAKGMYGCTEAMVVTNSTYTRAAVELARANHVTLWGRNRLVEVVLRVQCEGGTMSVQHEGETTPAVPLPFALEPSRPRPSAVADGLAIADACCATCGVQVSEKVRGYCLAYPERFSGTTYCFKHQKTINRQAA